MITTVFERLHTTKCSGFRGRGCTLFTVRSAAPNDLYVPIHSVVFKLQILTVPSEDALRNKNFTCTKYINMYENIIFFLIYKITIPDNIMTVWGKNDFIYERRVAAKFLESFAGFKAVYSAKNICCRYKL